MSRPTFNERQEMAWDLYAAAHALQAGLQSGMHLSGLDPVPRAAAYADKMLKERQERYVALRG